MIVDQVYPDLVQPKFNSAQGSDALKIEQHLFEFKLIFIAFFHAQNEY